MNSPKILLFLIFLFNGIGQQFCEYSPSLGILISIFPGLYIIPKYKVKGLAKKGDKRLFRYLMLFIFIYILSYPHAYLIGRVPIEKTFLIANIIGYPVFILNVILITYRYTLLRKNIFKDLVVVMSSILLLSIVLFRNSTLQSSVHAIAGRFNLPLFTGIYDVAKYCVVLGIISCVLFLSKKNILYFIIFLFSLVCLYLTNSRTQFLGVLVTLIVFFLSIGRFKKYIPVITISIIPILVAFNVILVRFASVVSSAPVFEFLFKQRTDFHDLMTMNSRMLIWKSSIEALSRFNLSYLFGFGYKAFYVLGLTDEIAKTWGGGTDPLYVHLHSGYLMLFFDTGLIGVFLFFLLIYKTIDKITYREIAINNEYRLIFLILVYFLVVMIESPIFLLNYIFIVFIISICTVIFDQLNGKKS